MFCAPILVTFNEAVVVVPKTVKFPMLPTPVIYGCDAVNILPYTDPTWPVAITFPLATIFPPVTPLPTPSPPNITTAPVFASVAAVVDKNS